MPTPRTIWLDLSLRCAPLLGSMDEYQDITAELDTLIVHEPVASLLNTPEAKAFADTLQLAGAAVTLAAAALWCLFS